MWRLFLLLLPIFIIAISPATQQRLLKDTAFLRNPYHRWQAKNRVEEITRHLEHQASTRGDFPTRLNFEQYLQEQEPDRSTLDPWGTPYYLEPRSFHVRIGSAGQDRAVGTEDDILSPLIRAPDHPVYQSQAPREDSLVRSDSLSS
jgi:hypothetical protein